LGLLGRHQIDNAAVAICLAELLRDEGFDIPHSAIVSGLENTTHAGRLELIAHQPPFLIDGAHNPDGARSLRSYLDEFVRRPLTLVFGAMRDKQLEQIGEILFPRADVLVLTTVNNPRGASVEALESTADRFAKGKVMKAQSSPEALRIATETTPPDGLICIAGSLYLIGELRPLLLSMR
jgi:dihydrofolate synthase/folylpolyglutamate synthase